MTNQTKVAVLEAEAITTKEETPFQIVLRRFRKHKMAMFSLGLIIVIFSISLFAPFIAPFQVDELSVGKYFVSWGTVDEETGRVHYMGTDHIGRDYFSRLVYAGRISLSVALLSVFISSLIGISVGAYAGYYGGIIDTLVMRFVEFLLTIPDLPLLLIISSMLISNPEAIPIPEPILAVAGKIMLLSTFQARQAVLIIIVLAGLGWLGIAQLMRGVILSLREQTFVEASRSLGASDAHIIFRHMIPNAMAPIIVAGIARHGGVRRGGGRALFLRFWHSGPNANLGQYAFCNPAIYA